MPGKIDSRSFNYAKQADTFLRLVPTGPTPSPPPGKDSPDSVRIESGQSIWRDLANNPDAVTSYVICLMAKLISLDSGQGVRPLPDVYKEITELQVDVGKYKGWCNKEKPLPAALKAKAVILQYAIVATIHFLKQFYGFTPSVQLRNMYLRWNLARKQIADSFEAQVMSSFSVASSKDPIRDLPLSSVFSTSDSEQKMVKELIDDCYLHHKRSFFGSLPPETSKLTKNSAVASSLSYIRLRDLLSRSPLLLNFAMSHICSLLQTSVSHTQDYGEREVLLPLLHLLKELLTMMVDVDHRSVYQLLMPFYTWPASHSESVKEALGMLQLEKKARGTLYRRTLLSEHQLDLTLKLHRPKAQTVVMLVDTSDPSNCGNSLYQSMVYHQEKAPTSLIKRLLLCSVFHSVPSNEGIDISEVETSVCRLSDENLTSFCEEGIDLTEEAVAMETVEEAKQFLNTEISGLYKKILANLEENPSEFTAQEDRARGHTSFVLPPPYIPVYELEQTHFSPIVEKLQEVLMRIQKGGDVPVINTDNSDALMMSYPPPNQPSSNNVFSLTSLASSGSCSVDEFNNPKSSSDLTCISDDNRGGVVQNGINRPMSPTAQSDPGMSLRIKKTGSPQGSSPRSPISRKGAILGPKSMSVHVTSNVSEAEGLGFGEMDSQSDTSSSRASEEIVSRVSTESSSNNAVKKIERRHTEHFGSSGIRRNLSIRGSGAYSNQIVSPTASVASIATGGSRGSVKQRANPSATGTLRSRRANTVGSAVRPRIKGKMKKVKIILAGNDICLSNTAKAFCHLRTKEPSLFSNLDVEFLYIPLSRALVGSSDLHPPTQAGSLDLPEPINEEGVEDSGRDVLIGQYLSHVDSWYEQNVMLAVHNALRLLLNDSEFTTRCFSMLEGLDTRWLPTPTPSRVVVNIAANFLREALHPIHAKVFRVKMTLRSDKASKGFEHRESFMFHRIDIQRLSGKKSGNRQAKPYEASLVLTELSLDNSFIKSDLVQLKDVWIIRGSNIPHPWDLGVPNPESECFELTVLKFFSNKHKTLEELQHHVYEMVVETGKEKPLSVIIDSDVSSVTENVIRVEVSPAYVDQAVTGSSLRRTERQERQMDFPLMTFWPVDL